MTGHQLCLLDDQQTGLLRRVGPRLEVPESLGTIEFTHGLHRFPGKFIPQIPRYIFKCCLPDSGPILDPFCGSGTTLVECMVAGRACIGTDLDPLAILLAKAKTTPLNAGELKGVERALSLAQIRKTQGNWRPEVPTLSHWFSESAVEQLSAIKASCLELPPKTRAFALCVFSSIIRRVSNADDQTQKTYVSHTKKKTPPAPFDLLPVFVNRALPRMAQFTAAVKSPNPAKVFRHDARESYSSESFRHIVTSPPYIDSIDYVYNQMLEYFWLLPELGLHTHDAFKKFRKTPLGMRHDSPHLPTSLTRDKVLKRAIVDISKVSPREAAVVKTFFAEYDRHLDATAPCQPVGGYYVTVVGRSFIRGASVPTPDALVCLHQAKGYRLVDRFAYSIQRHYMKFPRHSSSRKISEDHVLVFERVS